MPDPSSSVHAQKGGYDLNALINLALTPSVPYSEWAARRHYGATLDTTQIEQAIRFAEVGIMWPVTDLEQETLALNPAAQSFLTRAFVPIAMADYDVTEAEGDFSPQEKADAKRIAGDVRTMLRGIRGGSSGGSFRQGLLDLAWSFAWGRAASEKHMVRTVRARPDGGTTVRTVPIALNWIAPQRLSYDEDRRLIAISRFSDSGLFVKRGPSLDEVPGKFVSLQPRCFSDLQEREGLAVRFLYWLLFDRFQWRRRLEVLERMADPKGIVEQDLPSTGGSLKLSRNLGGEGGAPGDDGASLDETAAAVRAVMQRFGVFIGRPGEKLRFEYPPGEISDLFSEGSDQILRYLEMLATHALMTAKESVPRAGLVVQKGDQELLLDFRAALVAEAVQRDIIDHHVELNFGPDALVFSPSFALQTSPSRDRSAEVDRILKTAAAVPVGAGVLYDASGTRPPNEGEQPITAIALTPSGTEAITRVDEGRVKNGLPPVGGVDGAKWIIEQSSTYSAFGQAKGEAVGGGAPPAGSASPPREPAMPEDQSNTGQDAIGALAELGEDADADDQADAADDEANGGHLARFFASPGRLTQPSSVHGSPDKLVERGVREGVRSTATWADELVDAAHGTDAPSIYRNLIARAKSLNVEPFTRALERRLVHTLMLGALDADHEATTDTPIAPVAFAAGGIPNFTTMPFGEAIAAFNAKQVMSRRQFDRLTAAAKHKAFTVAGLSTQAMLTTAHDELSKAIAAGADLRDFSKKLGARFDAAGWTRLNPSHVENVFRTNVMGAYGDGRRAQMTQPAVLAARPYWQILGVDDARTRKTHASAHGKVLPANDPFFQNSGPPFGFSCRCRIISRSKKDLDRLGLTPTFGAALRGLPDPGWSADAIAPPASYEPKDGPPPKAEPPKYVAPKFDELPVEPLPAAKLPPEGPKAYLEHQEREFAKVSPEETASIARFTNGYDWAIREVDKGKGDDEILAAIRAHRATTPYKVFQETPEAHLAQAKASHRAIYTAVDRMAPVSPRVVYRGVRDLSPAVFKSILEAEHVEMGAISSASWNVGVARGFAEIHTATEGSRSVLFALKSKSARAIEMVSEFSGEKELLLKKGAKFRVTRIYRPDENAEHAAVIEAEEL